MKKIVFVLFFILSSLTVAYAVEGDELPLGTQTDGAVITEGEDGSIVIDTSALDGSASSTGLGAGFLDKPFHDYSVVEGFLLLFLLLFFVVICWLVVRRCFHG